MYLVWFEFSCISAVSLQLQMMLPVYPYTFALILSLDACEKQMVNQVAEAKMNKLK